MPTLARLSFFIPPEHLADFTELYDHQLTPLLQPHGLESGFSDEQRPSVAGVFSRLFAVESPAALIRTQQALRHDPAWQQGVQGLEARLGVPVRPYLGIYSTPAGEGQVKEAGPGRRQGLWHQFRVQDGLLSPSLVRILVDRQGRLWFATWEGACCFDGEKFTHFTAEHGLAASPVHALAEDREGNLWFGTGWLGRQQGQGLTRYDGRELVTFTPADGLGHLWVGALAEDRQGRVWAGTEGGLSCYEGGRFTTYTTDHGLGNSRVLQLCAGRDGRLWVGTDCGGLSYMEEGKITTFGVGEGLEHDKILSLAEDHQGRIWIGTEKGTSLFAEGKLQVFREGGPEVRRVRALLEDEEGQMWLGTYPYGVRCWDGRHLTVHGRNEGLSDLEVVALQADREGRIWAGTEGGGVCCLERRAWQVILPHPQHGPLAIESLGQDRQGRLWLGTNQGLSRFDGQEFMHLSLAEDQWHNLTRVIHEDRQGVIWSINYNGDVMAYDGQEWKIRYENEWRLGLNAYSIAEDPRGHLWFANAGEGVIRYDGQEWRVLTAQDGLVHDGVRVVRVDRQGRVWLATAQGGVSRYDGERFTTVSQGEELGYCAVWDMLEDRQGNLWFATWGAGVVRYEGHTFTRFTRQEGLVYDQVTCLWEDTQGHLWLGTHGGGVSRYDGRVFQILGQEEGLVSEVVHDVLEDGQGRIWLATKDGLVGYRPSRTPPQVRLRDVVADRSYGPAQAVSLSASQGLVRFEFQGSSFTTRPDGFVYVYRLEGYDSAWQVTRQRWVEYYYLPLGEYTFQVQAVDRDLNYSAPATVKLEVVPDPEKEALKVEVSRQGNKGKLVGDSPALQELQAQVRRVAPTDLTVLIQGETGTGKGLVAWAVHAGSPRRDGVLITVDCGRIPEGLVESTLFGHERGAFTGAVVRKLGTVETAQGGTLFLDEIGDLPLPFQVKLLRLLEERTFERVGGTEVLKSDARVIAATNRDLEQMVQEGTFRQDLYYRLKVFPLRVPALRERREDIPALARHFLEAVATHQGKEVPGLSRAALRLLVSYDWPGNVRELEHALARAVTVWQGGEIQAEDLAVGSGVEAGLAAPGQNGNGQVFSMEETERRHILAVLEKTGWLIQGEHGAARLLGLAPSTLRSKMQKLGIRRGR